MTIAVAEMPRGGIPLPGGGTATAITMPATAPLPALTFNPGAGGTMPVLSPWPGVGPTTGAGAPSIPTDAITVISVNPLSTLDASPLTAIVTTATSATLTVNADTNLSIATPQVIHGQLSLLQNDSTGSYYPLLARQYGNLLLGRLKPSETQAADRHRRCPARGFGDQRLAVRL